MLETFALAADQDRALEHARFLHWKQTQNMNAKTDQRQLGRGGGGLFGRTQSERSMRSVKSKQISLFGEV